MPDERASFPPEFECVGEARWFVRRVLADWGLGRFEERASLAVTELASNSVLHARTLFEVTVSFDGESVRIGVSDDSPRVPAAKSHTAQATTGRGLSLVAAVAGQWTVEARPGGKTVWCSFGTAGSEDPSASPESRAGATTAGRPAPGPEAEGRAADPHTGRDNADDRFTTLRRAA